MTTSSSLGKTIRIIIFILSNAIQLHSLKSLSYYISRISSFYLANQPLSAMQVDLLMSFLRLIIQKLSSVEFLDHSSKLRRLQAELVYISLHSTILSEVFRLIKSPRVLYVGQAYYNSWYLSRSLRALGWKADVLNWDENPNSALFYHGHDYSFHSHSYRLFASSRIKYRYILNFYIDSLFHYDIFHFANAHGIRYGFRLAEVMPLGFRPSDHIHLLRRLGRVIVYSNNGCYDGVAQSSFAKWGPVSPCESCNWRHNPDVCSDSSNLSFGNFRNGVAHYQCILGGNRVDYNIAPTIRETPQFYCLSEKVWHPNIKIPKKYLIPSLSRVNPPLLLYHTIGNSSERTTSNGVNIKSSHVYLPLVQKLLSEGFNVELISPKSVPNRIIRYYQVQSDIFLDMLTFGWFGATAREALMLGKPVICFIRPSWLESVQMELPEYASELPVITATPENIEDVLKALISNSDLRREIGIKSRRFALKWHSDSAASKHFNQLYRKLIDNPDYFSRRM